MNGYERMPQAAGQAAGRADHAVKSGGAPKICHVDLRDLERGGDAFAETVNRAAARGFSHLDVGSLFRHGDGEAAHLIADHRQALAGIADGKSLEVVLGDLRNACERQGLVLLVDLVLDRVALGGPSATSLGGAYGRPGHLNPLDPRVNRADLAAARLQEGGLERAQHWWAALAEELVGAGAGGFRLIGLDGLPLGTMGPLVDAICRAATDNSCWAWTPGLGWSRHPELSNTGIAGVFASTCWWDGRSPWYVEEQRSLRGVAPVLGIAGDPDLGDSRGRTAHIHAASSLERHRRDLMVAAATTDGLFVPASLLVDGLQESVDHAATLADDLARRGLLGELRSLTSPDQAVTVLLRVDAADVRSATAGIAIALNTDLVQSRALPLDLGILPPSAGLAMGEPAAGSADAPGESALQIGLLPGEVRVTDVAPHPPIVRRRRSTARTDRRAAQAAAAETPVAIEAVRPQVAGGDFAVKCVVGRPLVIEADVFADGHDVIAAEIVWSAADGSDEQRTPMIAIGNDRWRAAITPRQVGRHSFVVRGWRDEYGSLCHALEVKHRAGVDVGVEIAEAAVLLQTLPQTPPHGLAVEALQAAAAASTPDEAVTRLTSKEARVLVASLAEHRLPAQSAAIAVEVERPQAEFAAWYELFPRSLSGDADRHGTFDDVVADLPRVAAMGFDVLYFPPIHPIGRANRKGRNNSLTAEPGEPGSPYAIGGAEGGHDALHPELGTEEDFRRLVAAAHANGLEIALDFAIQCSLDHPWLREHPQWFRRRPDGTIKYAENPPKKYEDIVNVDFYADGAIPDLWLALRDVVLHWAGQGVRLFRVDNPHTKPLPFWHWMIEEVRSRYPDAVFLSEAFTRPKMMYRLAKVGFSQSYTYFTWRNTKTELVDYMRELTTSEVVDFFRPHFFVNTPDINPTFLQGSGRPGFLIRACLASTLSGLWGVYSGFELCEAAALPGREEYLDSEKYQLRPRDFAAPGNIVAEIAMLNRLRRMYPALQSHRGLTFYNAFNDQVMVYGKRQAGDRDLILVAVSLDPHRPQQASFEMPLWEWGLPDDGALAVEDLVLGGKAVWQGKIQTVRLDPMVLPFALWRLTPRDAAADGSAATGGTASGAPATGAPATGAHGAVAGRGEA